MPPLSPRDWTYADARQLLDRSRPAWQDSNRKFYEGDHWQEGAGWPGPHIADGGKDANVVLGEIHRGFLSANKIEEVVNRHRDAVAGKAIMFQVAPKRFLPPTEAPTAQELADIRAVEAALTGWWDARKVQQVILGAVGTALWAQRVIARLYVPPQLMVTNETTTGVLRSKTIDEAFTRIYPEALAPDMATIYVQDVTRQTVAIYLSRVTPPGAEGEVTIIELMFADAASMVYRKLTEGQEATETVNIPMPATAPLPMAELALATPLINEQVRQHQQALNLCLSMIPRNIITAGFLERTMLNAQMPGSWEYNKQGEPVKFNPDAFEVGAGSTAFVTGISYKDAQGNQHVTDPSIVYREPIDPKGAIDAFNALYANILSEVQQEHVLTNSMALMSGKSREQARAGFEKSVRHTKHATEAFTQDLLTAALVLAEYFSGTSGKYSSKYRVIATCHIDVGPAGAEERAQDAELVKNGGMAIETAMERAGIVDVDAELSRIQALPTFKVARWNAIFTAMGLAATAGITIEAAAELMSLPTADIAILKQSVKDAQNQLDNQPTDGTPPPPNA